MFSQHGTPPRQITWATKPGSLQADAPILIRNISMRLHDDGKFIQKAVGLGVQGVDITTYWLKSN